MLSENKQHRIKLSIRFFFFVSTVGCLYLDAIHQENTVILDT